MKGLKRYDGWDRSVIAGDKVITGMLQLFIDWLIGIIALHFFTCLLSEQ